MTRALSVGDLREFIQYENVNKGLEIANSNIRFTVKDIPVLR